MKFHDVLFGISILAFLVTNAILIIANGFIYELDDPNLKYLRWLNWLTILELVVIVFIYFKYKKKK